jgi:hypothetical protein
VPLAKKRKILIFAHVPPPRHRQSVVVQVFMEGLQRVVFEVGAVGVGKLARLGAWV